MPRTLEETRAYARGYNAAKSRGWTWAKQLLDLLVRYRDRSKTPEDRLRRCSGCHRWEPGPIGVQWGRCKADFDYAAEPRMWVESADIRAPRIEGVAIFTNADFGCVNWAPPSKRDLR